jgi:tetratricopeptide (TPR) repeat protein
MAITIQTANGPDKVFEASIEQVAVIPSGTNTPRPGEPGYELFAKDKIKTGNGVQVTLLFIDGKGPHEVIMLDKSEIEIDFTPRPAETQSRAGLRLPEIKRTAIVSNNEKLWPVVFCFACSLAFRVRGFFRSRTDQANIDVESTEYKLEVKAGESGEVETTVIPTQGKVIVTPVEGAQVSSSQEPMQGARPQPAAFVKEAAFLSGQTARPEILKPGDVLTIGKNKPLSKKGDEKKARDTVDELSEAIFASLPTAPAKNIPPYFKDTKDRRKAFFEARQDIFLKGDVSEGYEDLAKVYVDLGLYKAALETFDKAKDEDWKPSKEFLTGRGEALTLAKRLDEAETDLKDALKIDPNNFRANAAMVNVKLARVVEALRIRAPELARCYLKESAPYIATFQNVSILTETTTVKAALLTILADFHLLSGDVNLVLKDVDEAEDSYTLAERHCNNAKKMDPEYALAFICSADAKRELGTIFKSSSKKDIAKATKYFNEATEDYNTVLRKHNDSYLAYSDLANLDSLRPGSSSKEAAMKSYDRAVKFDPYALLKEVCVPDVKFKKKAGAIKLLTDAGLVPIAEGAEEGYILEQSLPLGSKVKKGETITLKVGTRPETAAKPDKPKDPCKEKPENPCQGQ